MQYEVEENTILELRTNVHAFQVNFVPTEQITDSDYETFQETTTSNNNPAELADAQEMSEIDGIQKAHRNSQQPQQNNTNCQPELVCARCNFCNKDEDL